MRRLIGRKFAAARHGPEGFLLSRRGYRVAMKVESGIAMRGRLKARTSQPGRLNHR
jgi:hypothetical protein